MDLRRLVRQFLNERGDRLFALGCRPTTVALCSAVNSRPVLVTRSLQKSGYAYPIRGDSTFKSATKNAPARVDPNFQQPKAHWPMAVDILSLNRVQIDSQNWGPTERLESNYRFF